MDSVYIRYGIPSNERFIAREAYERIRYITLNFEKFSKIYELNFKSINDDLFFIMMYDFCKRDFMIREALTIYTLKMPQGKITKNMIFNYAYDYLKLFENQKKIRDGEYNSLIVNICQKLIKNKKYKISRLRKLDVIQEYYFLSYFNSYPDQNYFERHVSDFLSYVSKKLKK